MICLRENIDATLQAGLTLMQTLPLSQRERQARDAAQQAALLPELVELGAHQHTCHLLSALLKLFAFRWYR